MIQAAHQSERQTAMLPQVSKILYSTDLSDSSGLAFGYAVAMAKATGAEIHVLHVVERLSEDAVITLSAFIQDPKQRSAAIHERNSRAAALLAERQDDFWSTLSDADAALRERVKSVEVIESFPAETILKKSRELGCDLIIMGGHGRGVSHNFLGSVAKSVLRRSNIPTLIVPLPDV